MKIQEFEIGVGSYEDLPEVPKRLAEESFLLAGVRGKVGVTGNLQKGIDQHRIKLIPGGERFQDLHGLRGTLCRLIGTLGGDGIEDVSNLEDARQEWDILADCPIRISRTIPALMMAADNGEHLSQRRHGATDLLALDRVALHQDSLFRGEWPLFQ